LTQEENIVQNIQHGNLDSFEVLFRTYYKELCNYVYQYFHDKDTAEEIVQDLFYKLWVKKETLMIRTSIRSYLYKSAYNNTMLLLREKNTRQMTDAIPENPELIPVIEPDALLQASELDKLVQSTMSSMPIKVRRIFELSRFEGLKYKEIADRLSISIKTVEANMGKALKLFRKNLKEYYE
jgi:RNA polymerase sigma-70 factor, ECF subfamily